MHLRLTTKLEKQKQEEQTHLRNDRERETERDKHETPTTTTTTLLKKQTLKKNCLQKGVCHQWATLLWTSNPINTISKGENQKRRRKQTEMIQKHPPT
jgi:hypothetical protein